MLSKLMTCRYEFLVKNFLGYQKTGISLIEFDGTKLSPTLTADDIGVYVIIPKIAHFFNLSIQQAINIFFYAILFIPILIGGIGLFLLYKKPLQRIISLIGLLFLMRQAYAYGDAYLSYVACSVIIIPWSLYFVREKKYTNNLLLYTFTIGLLVGFFQYIRSYSGIGALLFSIALYCLALSLDNEALNGLKAVVSRGITPKQPAFAQTLRRGSPAIHLGSKLPRILATENKQKIKLIVALLLGLALPITYFNYAYYSSKNYAQKVLQLPVDKKAHTFWHPVYLGFGFLKQGAPENIEYKDTFCFQMVDTIAPGTVPYSARYEEILKNKVINLFKNHFQFVLFTLFAKIGIMLFYLLKFANIGLIFALIYRKPWFLELPFWIALSFYSLFPLLAIPTFGEYALGFVACATLYAIISINYALDHGFLYKLKKILKI